MLSRLRDAASHLDTTLFSLGTTPVTPLSLVIFAGSIAVAVILARLAASALRRYGARRGWAEGTSYALERMLNIAAISLGLVIGIQNVGIDLTALAAVGAMLSVGIGFGLQGVAQNFISGIALLVERPVQKGDFVVIGDTIGTVEDISMRATRIVTRDHVAIIVPNNELLTSKVTNMSHPSERIRVRVKVGVSYSSDTDLVERILREVVEAHGEILDEPPVEVLFRDFGASSLDFEVMAWIAHPRREPQISSDLRFAILAAFRREGVEIPFPQRDVHVRTHTPPSAC